MKNNQTNNFILKLVSLLFAIILWIVVVNIDDPDATRTITGIQVNPLDVNVIEDKNQVYTIVYGEKVDIQVTGPRSQVDKMTKDDFIAEAPFSEKSNVDAVPIYVTFRNSKYEKSCEISQKNMTMKLQVEDIVSKSYEIELNCQGTESQGYMIGKEVLSPSVVTVSAPTSVINLISKVQVNVDISGQVESFDMERPIEYYTETGSLVKMSDTVKVSTETVNASIQIYSIKEVPLKFGSIGSVADGYELVGITSSRPTIKIAGPDVNQMDSITLPDELLDITGATADVSTSVDIGAHIPSGMTVVDAEDQVMVTLTAKVEELIQRNYSIPISEIDINNLPEKYEADFMEQSVSLRFSGLQSAHDSLRLGDLNAYVDLKNVREGVNEVIVKLTIPEGMKLISDVRADVLITSLEPETTTEATSENVEEDTTKKERETRGR